MTCPTDDALLEALTHGQPGEWAEHLASCARCQRVWALGEAVAAPVPGEPETEAAMAALMTRVRASEPGRARLPRWVLPLAASVVVISTFALLRPTEVFTPRGRPEVTSLTRDVGFTFRTLAEADNVLTDGAHVASNARLLMVHRNLRTQPTYALVFAVDSRGTVHWLYPGHEAEASNEASVALATSLADHAASTAVEMAAPAQGQLTVFALATEAPLHVRDVESLPKVNAEVLRTRFKGAAVTSLGLVIE